MAYATQLTISTGNKVRLNYQSQEVSVTLTYQLEREDGDLLAVVREKAAELARAHQTAWQTLRDAKVRAAGITSDPQVPPAVAPGEPTEGTAAVSGVTSPLEANSAAIIESAAILEQASHEPTSPAAPGQVAALALLLNQCGWSDEQRQQYLHDRCACESLEDLTAHQAAQWLLELQRGLRLAAQEQRLREASREASLNGNRSH